MAARLTALALALSCLALPRLLRHRRGPAILQTLAPALAAALSAAYVVLYLRGGPRIIDATSYWLQASLFAQGDWGLPVDGPEQAVLGRFLLLTPNGDASVIFPPGYPAVLSLGFVVGAPLAVGPALAAALTFATMDLSRRVLTAWASSRDVHRPIESLVAVAGLLSATCAALRYHTADTMSHGLAALLVCVTLSAALHLRQQPRAIPTSLLLGLALGWLAATRPVSALATAAATLLVGRPSLRASLTIAVGTLPGVGLWLAYQHHATGELLGVAQRAYYARSDGPPGCFRYGFGDGIGCLGEHGDFVRHNLADGYGPVEAFMTTARRMKLHVSDALGFLPSFAAVLAGMASSARQPFNRSGLRGIAALPLLIVVAYAPFYFDGNYPGGGARLFADALGVEQVLALVGALAISERVIATRPGLTPRRLAAALLALSFVGFAVYLEPDHALLRDREGGRPMYEPALAPPPGELLFVGTDHGFNLARAHRPAVARHHGHDHDRLVWEHWGRPTAWLYEFPFDGAAPPTRNPYAFGSASARLVLQGETFWPPRQQSHGWAWPSYVPYDGISGGQLLRIQPLRGGEPAEVTLALPRAIAGHTLRPYVVTLGDHGGRSVGILELVRDGAPFHTWTIPGGWEGRVVVLDEVSLPESPAATLLTIRAEHPVGLDRLQVTRIR